MSTPRNELSYRSRRIRAALIGAGLAVGTIGTTAAWAQSDSTPVPSNESSATATADAPPDAPVDGPRRHRPDPSALATELGVSVEELQAAMSAARDAVDAELGEPQRPSTPPTTEEEREAVKAEHQARHELMNQELAEELGISVEQLDAARLAVAEARIAEDVASGELTQEQADEILARISSGEAPGPHGPGGPGGPHGPGPRPDGPPPADAPVDQGS
jgi:predicted ribosomally synthesized peptide with SipW-like signal peptide